MLHKRSHCNEKPTHHNQRKLMQSNKDQAQSKMNNFFLIFLIYLKKKKTTKSTCNAGDSIPGLERSLDKEMATHFSIPASEIPRTEQPGGPQSMGLQRVRNNLATKTMLIISDYLVKLHIPYTQPQNSTLSHTISAN